MLKGMGRDAFHVDSSKTHPWRASAGSAITLPVNDASLVKTKHSEYRQGNAGTLFTARQEADEVALSLRAASEIHVFPRR